MSDPAKDDRAKGEPSKGAPGKGTPAKGTAGTDTAKRPAGTDTAKRPAGTDTAKSPAGTDTAKRPAGTDTAKSPAGTDTAKSPAGTDTAKSPAGTDTAKSPAGTDPAKRPAGTDTAKSPAGTDTANEGLERTARRIAQRGRDELVARLRPAFEQAAAAHGDLLELGPEQLESMVQRAADRADGLQWRRALAAVATEELEIGLGEALGHPAVARAQTIVGAPSYEDSLAQLTATRRTDKARVPQASRKPQDAGAATDPHAAHDPASGPQAAGAAESTQVAGSSGAAGGKSERRQQAVERRARIGERQQRIAQRQQQPREHQQQRGEEAGGEGDPPSGTLFPRLRLPAIHLGGIAKLAPGEADIVLRFSEEGLDIVRRSSAAALGRLGWSDISELEIPAGRGLRRRRRRQGAELVIRAGQGDANFEIPSLTSDQLRARLAPALTRLQR
ncbi:MAG: hypothetical protein ACR2IP_09045 [Solirubrobacteraceae bacterium]